MTALPSEGRPAFEGIKTSSSSRRTSLTSEGRPAFEGIKTASGCCCCCDSESEGRPAFEGIKTLAGRCARRASAVRRQTRFRGD